MDKNIQDNGTKEFKKVQESFNYLMVKKKLENFKIINLLDKRKNKNYLLYYRTKNIILKMKLHKIFKQ